METNTSSLNKNKAIYDAKYDHVNVDSIVQKVRNFRAFLDDAVQTDTSWHGMYQGDFAARIVNKSVLELGCGDGLNALVMGALGADVVAIDISKESENIIRKAASKLAVENVKGGGGDFLDLAFQARSFDFIIGKAFLHHLTHDQEAEYLKKVAVLLKTDGAARFFEPATNSLVLDKVRWMVPVPGRPSMLSRTAFAEWKARDPHPQRDNSSKHYSQVGKIFFDAVDIVYIGSIERLCRVLPRGDFNRRFRRWAHKVEKRMPMRLRHIFARSQLVTYRNPRVPVVELA